MSGLRMIWDALAAVIADAILESHDRQQREMDEAELDQLADALGRRLAARAARARAEHAARELSDDRGELN